MAEDGAIVRKDEDFAIKPQAVVPALDTSTWPLLLKNYDKRTKFAAPSTHPPSTFVCCSPLTFFVAQCSSERGISLLSRTVVHP